MITNIAFSQANPTPSSARNSPSAATEMSNVNNELNHFEDSVIQGYVREAATITYLSNNSFSTTGNTSAIYTVGRRLRLNQSGTPIYVTVLSSSYNGVITTITTYETTVTNPVSTVDIAIQPQGWTSQNLQFPTITNPTITNATFTGTLTGISINRGFPFNAAGVPIVGTDISWNPTAPQNVTAIKLWAYCKTAPTGSNVIFQIYNITQNAIVGIITINVNTQTASITSFTTAAIHAGDVLRLDMNQADSNSIGAGYSFVLECSQP